MKCEEQQYRVANRVNTAHTHTHAEHTHAEINTEDV